MKNLKAHHHFAIVSLLSLGIVSVWTWGSVVFASSSDITVYIGPPDVCQNIPGYQQELPEGMQVENSNCFTPPPAPAQTCEPQSTTACGTTNPTADYCKNIDGAQEKIPASMKRDSEGTCFTPAQLTQPQLPGATSTGESMKPGAFDLSNPWYIDTSALKHSPLSFLTPQIVIVGLTATVAALSLGLVRYHHHKLSGFSSHHRA